MFTLAIYDNATDAEKDDSTLVGGPHEAVDASIVAAHVVAVVDHGSYRAIICVGGVFLFTRVSRAEVKAQWHEAEEAQARILADEARRGPR